MQNKMTAINRPRSLEHTIARLNRRAQQLEAQSTKYWKVRRVLFVCGTLLALVFCKYSGGTTGVIFVSLFVAVFVVVTVYHNRVRESITRTALMINIKQVQVARINLDWDHLPLSDQSPPA